MSVVNYIADRDYKDEDRQPRGYKNLEDKEQDTDREDAKEGFLAHAWLCQSAKSFMKLWMDLSNDYFTGGNKYPKTHQDAFHVSRHYTKSQGQKINPQLEMAFTQNGGGFKKSKQKKGNKKNGGGVATTRTLWRKCWRCGQKGHPERSCPKKDKDDKDQSKSSKASLKQLTKAAEDATNAFATYLEAQQETQQEEQSELRDTDDEEESKKGRSGSQNFMFGERVFTQRQ